MFQRTKLAAVVNEFFGEASGFVILAPTRINLEKQGTLSKLASCPKSV